MAFRGYPQNLTFKAMTEGAYALGKTKPSFRGVDLSGIQNVANTVKNYKTPSKWSITTPYGGKTKYESFHPGVDLAAKIGTSIPAFVGGTVTGTQTGQVMGTPGFGNFVIITDAEGNQHRYSHLHESFVKINQPIAKGEILGTMGNTGQVYSRWGGDPTHLDYRIQSAYSTFVNPLKYLENF